MTAAKSITALLLASNIRFVEAITYQLEKVGMECYAVTSASGARDQARLCRPAIVILNAADLHSDQQVRSLTSLRRETAAPMIVLGSLNDTRAALFAKRLNAEAFASYPAPASHLMKCVRRVLWKHTTQRLDTPAVLALGDLCIDPDRFEARVCGRGVPLSLTEMEILYCLGVHANQIVTRETLLNCVWCREPSPAMMRVINSHMRGLREKIEPDRGRPRYLTTKRGIGYMLSTATP